MKPIQFFKLPGNVCPYAQRTHITLVELGLAFEATEVVGTPKPDWFLEINPWGQVPALKVPTEDYAVYESAICNEFLCDYATTKLQLEQRLMPNDPFTRATMRLLNDHCDIFAKSKFTFLLNKDVSKDYALSKEMELAVATYEDVLVKSKGPYLLGGEFTLADVHAFPFVQRLVFTLKHWKNFELASDKFPNVLLWLGSCSERESVKKTSISKEETIEAYKNKWPCLKPKP
ncbi:hypothetical protein ACHAXR_007329 [Thalassiosira sp. AJA248-18]